MPNGSYAAVIEKLRPGAAEPGEIVHLDGRVLGRARGRDPLHRRPAPRPRASAAASRSSSCGSTPRRGGSSSARARRWRAATVPVAEVNWLGDGAFEAAPAEGWEVAVRVRSTRPPKPARVHPDGPGRARVELLAPEEGVAPGQACVFYAAEGTRVLGGGWIARG